MFLIVGILGILIGSFLNVCIYRIPKKQDIVFEPSHCMACGQRIKWYDLIPIVSWIILGGKCRSCKNQLSVQYPLVELLNGLVYLGIFSYFGFSYETLFSCVLFSTLLVIFMIDIYHKIIPNEIVIFLIGVSLLQMFILNRSYVDSIIGFFTVSTLLLLIRWMSGGQMGMGDVKLMAAAGIYLGWIHVLLALFIASIVGSVVGLTLIGLKITKRKQQIPFGPYLSIGIMIAALFGQELVNAYIHLIF